MCHSHRRPVNDIEAVGSHRQFLKVTIWLFNIAMENPLSMEVSSWENHLFLWATYTMAMLNNQRVESATMDTNGLTWCKLMQVVDTLWIVLGCHGKDPQMPIFLVPNCGYPVHYDPTRIYMAMDQYLLIPFLVGWTSIYQLFWCELQGYQGFDPSPYIYIHIGIYMILWYNSCFSSPIHHFWFFEAMGQIQRNAQSPLRTWRAFPKGNFIEKRNQLP